MRVLFAAVMALVMTGCASVGTQVGNESVAQIKEGETTRSEVIQMLGQPNGTIQGSALSGESVTGITYSYSKTQVDAANFIPVVGLFVGGTSSENTMLQVYFDKDGVVTEKHYVTNNHESGGLM
ncbi:outer membrane protein assembly factor BamE [Marinobacter sp.]|uniref:outer membrane protein assembly factor BamE domain-containing protein n=1 Tax=Marinobacter sp. TaxID=50741 RepID=UPI003566D497